jgi:hypothetical protein
MFDIHHFGFCSSGCLFFDADRLFRAVFLGDGRATTAAWQSKKYRQQS